MTPQTKAKISQIAKARVPGWLLILGALLPVVAATAATARSVTAAVRDAADSRYANIDTLRIYREKQAAEHLRDSLVNDAKFAQLTTPMNALYRACQRRKECP